MDETAPACTWLGYDDDLSAGFRAVCNCGWVSEPKSTAGLAGAASDAHRAERAARDDQPS
jgi:hypothetical protein